MKNSKKIGQFPNTMVIISLTIALFLIGLCGLLTFQAKRLSKIVKSSIEMQVYLKDSLSKDQIYKIEKQLTLKKYVTKSDTSKSVTFLSKEKSAEEFIGQTGENFTALLDNPLQNAFLVRIDEAYFENDSLKKVKASFEQIKGVSEAVYMENLVSDVNKNMSNIYFILSGVAILLLGLIFVLVNNTIKLAVFSQRFLIRSMQLVGATDNFIQKPFIKRGLLQGLVSGLLAGFLLFLLQKGAVSKMPELTKLNNWNEFGIILFLLVFLGAAIGLVCTFISIYKYLRLTLDELYQ